MHASLRFGFGHALHAVSARLELELGIRALADDARDDFLVPAHLARAFGDHLDLPFVALGKTVIHAKQVAREQGRFVAARAAAHLDENVALVVRIDRQQRALQISLQRFHARPRRLHLVVGERLQVGIGEHVLRGGQITLALLPLAIQRHDRRDFGMLARQRAKSIEIARDVRRGEQTVEFLEASRQMRQFGGER